MWTSYGYIQSFKHFFGDGPQWFAHYKTILNWITTQHKIDHSFNDAKHESFANK
jgi:hypothetical protein